MTEWKRSFAEILGGAGWVTAAVGASIATATLLWKILPWEGLGGRIFTLFASLAATAAVTGLYISRQAKLRQLELDKIQQADKALFDRIDAVVRAQIRGRGRE